MRLKKIPVTFEATVTITIYAPEDADDETICRLCDNVAFEIGCVGGAWDVPDFEAFIGRTECVDVPDEDLVATPPNRYGYRRACTGSPLDDADVVVLSDSGDDLVNPSDAKWWMHDDHEEDPSDD